MFDYFGFFRQPRFNPNNEYGWDIAPSMENYNSALPKREDYPHKKTRGNFGSMEGL